MTGGAGSRFDGALAVAPMARRQPSRCSPRSRPTARSLALGERQSAIVTAGFYLLARARFSIYADRSARAERLDAMRQVARDRLIANGMRLAACRCLRPRSTSTNRRTWRPRAQDRRRVTPGGG